MKDAPVDSRRPGRPRNAAAELAVLQATLDEYGAHGFQGMSVDAVAARAEVSKATIYRRYESKLGLVTAAMYHAAARKPIPDTGSLAGDLRALLAHLARAMSDPVQSGSFRVMVNDAVHEPALGAVHEELVRLRRTPARTVLERAVARGELRPDVDLDLAVDMLTGPVFHRHLVTHMPIDARFLDRLVGAFLRAFSVDRGGSP